MEQGHFRVSDPRSNFWRWIETYTICSNRRPDWHRPIRQRHTSRRHHASARQEWKYLAQRKCSSWDVETICQDEIVEACGECEQGLCEYSLFFCMCVTVANDRFSTAIYGCSPSWNHVHWHCWRAVRCLPRQIRQFQPRRALRWGLCNSNGGW
jgi:hypothetical protein